MRAEHVTPLDDANFTRSVRLDLNQTYSPNPLKKGFIDHLKEIKHKINQENHFKEENEKCYATKKANVKMLRNQNFRKISRPRKIFSINNKK